MGGVVGDDKGDYEANPVRTHLPMAPSEERALPERQQVREGYGQEAEKSNRCIAGELRAGKREVPGALHQEVPARHSIGGGRLAETRI